MIFEHGRGKPRNADDTPFHSGGLRSSFCHAGQRWAHLSGYAKNDKVSVEASQRADRTFGWLAEKVFQLRYVLNGSRVSRHDDFVSPDAFAHRRVIVLELFLDGL